MRDRLLVLVGALALALAGAGPAAAHPSHGSCEVFGNSTAALAQAGILQEVIKATPPGDLDDAVAFFHGLECDPK